MMTARVASAKVVSGLFIAAVASLTLHCGKDGSHTTEPDTPLIELSTGSVNFSATEGGDAPPSQPVAVTNRGTGTLSGLAASISYTSGQPTGWLSANHSVATAPSTLTLTAATGSLSAGTYTASVAVTSGVASNSPQAVNVTFTVNPGSAPTPPAAPSGLTATAASSSQVNLSWTDNASTEDGFRIERCSGAGCTSFAEIASVGPNISTYQSTGLTAGTAYGYRVRAYNGAGNSTYSNSASATTQPTAPTPPTAPSGLAATAPSSSQINLSWTDNASTEDGFRIERCSGASCASFVEITTVGPNTTSYQSTGLTASTAYGYRVRAYNVAGNSAYSNTAAATTQAAAPTPPAAPSGLTATAASSSQINLSWTDNASTEDGFRIERCSGASCASFVEITTVGPNVTSYQSTGLTASTAYGYRVRAYNAAGNSAYSNTASATTQPPSGPVPPAAPSGLTATAASSSQINLGWTDNASTEDGFRIERCTGASCASFVEITTVGPNVTSYQSTGLTASTAYGYRVRAYNAAGTSAYSNTAAATTQAAAPTLPAAPSGLTATATSTSQINLGWTDNASNEDGFRVEQCLGGSCTNFGELGTVGANTTTVSITALSPGTTYRYRVRAYNAVGNSSYSNIAAATTAGSSTTTFRNNAEWAVIFLTIDGSQQITVPGTGIAPGSAFTVALSPGVHQYEARTGFWDGNSRFDVYVWRGTFTQVAGVSGTVTIDDPTIVQIMTRFGASHLWEGEYYDSNRNFHIAGLRFRSNGTCTLYSDGNVVIGCTYSLVDYTPGIVTFRVRYSDGSQFNGSLDELNAYFYMRNGPSSWPTIKYTATGRP